MNSENLVQKRQPVPVLTRTIGLEVKIAISHNSVRNDARKQENDVTQNVAGKQRI